MAYDDLIEQYVAFENEMNSIISPVMKAFEAGEGNQPGADPGNAASTNATNANTRATTQTGNAVTRDTNTTNNDRDARNMNRTSVQQIENKKDQPGLGRKILDAIKEALDKLIAFIRRASLKMKNALRKVMVTDKGFKDQLRQREMTIKPLESAKITQYQYLDPFIDTFVNKLKRLMDESMRDMERSADPRNPQPVTVDVLKLANNKMVPGIIRELTNKGDIVNLNQLQIYLGDEYRGQKRERLITKADLPQIIKMAEDYRKYNVTYDKYLTDCNTLLTKMQNRKNQLVDPNITDEQKKDFLAIVNKASILMNFYSTVLMYIYELKVERALNYRIIVQKFYQF